MGQQCSICSHEKLQEVNQAIAAGASLRKLASRFADSIGVSTAAYHRHKHKCVPEALSAKRQAEREVELERQAVTRDAFREATLEVVRAGPVLTAVTVEAELGRQFARVNKLQDACDKFLSHPAVPNEYLLDAHASEIKIVWEEIEGWREMGPAAELPENPVWVRRRGTLQEALALAFCNGHARHVSTQPIKFADPRKLVIEAAAELRALVELLARLEGRFRPVEKELGAGDTIQFNTVVNILQSAGVPIR